MLNSEIAFYIFLPVYILINIPVVNSLGKGNLIDRLNDKIGAGVFCFIVLIVSVLLTIGIINIFFTSYEGEKMVQKTIEVKGKVKMWKLKEF